MDYVEVGEGIDPFEFFAAFDGETVGVLHEFALSEVDS